jgi:hypothetical protein
VLDAGGHQGVHVVVSEAVVDHPPVAPRLHQLAIPEQSQLMADRGHREIRDHGEIAHAQFIGHGQGMQDPDSGGIRQGREQSTQAGDGLLGQPLPLDEGHRLGVDLVDGAEFTGQLISHGFIVAGRHATVNLA